jgi:signal transduction protein with GAF and PtsI domain
MSPSAVPVIKHIIRGSQAAEMRALCEEVLASTSARDASALVVAAMRRRFPEHLRHGGGAASEGDD